MKHFTLILLCIFVLASCYKDKEDLLYGNVVCETTEVSFSNDVMPIISNSCAVVGCHVQGGNGSGIFENYNQIKTKVDNGSLMQRVVNDRDMPPTASLSACQIQYIQQWIADGAPNN